MIHEREALFYISNSHIYLGAQTSYLLLWLIDLERPGRLEETGANGLAEVWTDTWDFGYKSMPVRSLCLIKPIVSSAPCISFKPELKNDF